MNAKWFFVINPVSGKGAGLKLWQEIKPSLEAANIKFEFAEFCVQFLNCVEFDADKLQGLIEEFSRFDRTTLSKTNYIFILKSRSYL